MNKFAFFLKFDISLGLIHLVSTQNVSKNWHFLPLDTHTRVRISYPLIHTHTHTPLLIYFNSFVQSLRFVARRGNIKLLRHKTDNEKVLLVPNLKQKEHFQQWIKNVLLFWIKFGCWQFLVSLTEGNLVILNNQRK